MGVGGAADQAAAPRPFEGEGCPFKPPGAIVWT